MIKIVLDLMSGNYDKAKELVIDPIVYATYLEEQVMMLSEELLMTPKVI